MSNEIRRIRARPQRRVLRALIPYPQESGLHFCAPDSSNSKKTDGLGRVHLPPPPFARLCQVWPPFWPKCSAGSEARLMAEVYGSWTTRKRVSGPASSSASETFPPTAPSGGVLSIGSTSPSCCRCGLGSSCISVAMQSSCLFPFADASRLRREGTSSLSHHPLKYPAPLVPNPSMQDPRERARLFRELHAFRLCRQPRPREAQLRFFARIHAGRPGRPLNDWSHLPYSVKFLVEVSCLMCVPY